MTPRYSFPLAGDLIRGSELHAWLFEAIPLVDAPIRICSAYMRSEAMQPLLSRLPEGSTGKVLVRWRFEDLVKGSSDLSLFALCKQRGLKLFMRQQFHGKVYAIPPIGIGMGSANATLSGFGLHTYANTEVCTLVPQTPQSLAHVDSLFGGATLIDDDLFMLLSDACAAVIPNEPIGDWPDEVLKHMAIESSPQHFLVDECLWSDGKWAAMGRPPSGEAEIHDQLLLGIEVGTSLPELQRALGRCLMLNWLRAQLEDVSSRELYFGNLSQRLHSTLLDDPGPRRSEVKTLLQNLLSWIEAVAHTEIVIDRPQYSQRVRLTVLRSR